MFSLSIGFNHPRYMFQEGLPKNNSKKKPEKNPPFIFTWFLNWGWNHKEEKQSVYIESYTLQLLNAVHLYDCEANIILYYHIIWYFNFKPDTLTCLRLLLVILQMFKWWEQYNRQQQINYIDHNKTPFLKGFPSVFL